MAGPHPGKWQVVEQNAQVNATHASLLRTGKVLYWRAWGTPYESRIWNPTTGQITTQVIPPWPAPKNNVDPPISYGSQFQIVVSEIISSAVLIRPGSVTHALDMEQRYVELSLGNAVVNGGVSYPVQSPANANIAPPGYYMLFVLKPKQQSLSGQTSVPSVASWVRLV